MPDSYQLPPPDAAGARRALQRALGDDRADRVWRECAGADVDDDMTPRELLSVAARIADRQGIESIVGLSLQVRCETWLALYARQRL